MGFYMVYKRNTGLYDEDHVNSFNASTYTPVHEMVNWYKNMERITTQAEMLKRQRIQSQNNQEGRHHSGAGPFERELERKGIPVEKYPLTTTTGATRIREMIVLRRLALEEKAKAALAKQAGELRRPAPSEWYDETKGPLNPRFLQAMQVHYDVPIVDLPRTPLSYETFKQRTAKD